MAINNPSVNPHYQEGKNQQPIATMKLLLFLLVLSVGFHFCSTESDEITDKLTQRRPPPPRRSPPPPRRSPPPPPRRSPPPPPPRRSPPPPPRRSPPPPPPRRSPPPPPRRSPPPPPPRRSPPPPPRRSPPPPPPRLSPPPPFRPPPPPFPPLPEPGFDFFVLSLRWPNAFCELPGNTCDPSPPKQDFTIHGLWPQKYFQILPVEFCRQESPMTLPILLHFREELLEFWPRLHSADDFERSTAFWFTQWLRYGSCSSNEFPPESYIDKTITLGSNYGPLIKDELEAAGIEPNGEAYNWETILEAVKVATGKEANLSCDEDSSGTLLLHEIRICIEPDAETPMNCARRYTPDKCRTDLVFASPPSSLGTPSLVSSI